ncbi:DUF2207 domain-containing protein [Salipiger sp.]|uniref:DUF2207 domain-containing protein n=1 Tax=Salipiger sp. TaxID=2078585 RepID=UPI003A982261
MPYDRHSKLRSLLTPLLLLAGLLLFGQPTSAAERIVSFDSDIRLATSGELTVAERLEVASQGFEIRHGIFRDFPTVRAEQGGLDRSSFSLLSASIDGAPAETRVVKERDFVRVYVGDEDTVLRRGRHVVEIRYRTDRQVQFGEDRDALIWNVTGTRWSFPIGRAQATLHLPEGAGATDVVAHAGPYGAQGGSARWDASADGRTVRIETTAPLDRQEGLTFDVSFPQGIVAQPTLLDRLIWSVQDRAADWVALLGTVLLLLGQRLVQSLVGGAPAAHAVRERRTPPDDVSPALAAYVAYNGHLGDQTMIAAAMNLGRKGLVTIDQNGKHWSLARTAKAPGPLPAGEAALLEGLEAAGGGVEVTPANRGAVETLLSAFRRAVEGEHGESFYRWNGGWMLAMAIACYATAGLVSYLCFIPREPVLIVVGLVPLLLTGICLIPALARAGQSRAREAASVLALGLSLSCFVWVVFGVLSGITGILPSLALIALPVSYWIFASRIGRPTELGQARKAEIAGLKAFLTSPDAQPSGEDRPLEREDFEALLPYAVALGLETQWSRAFAQAFGDATSEPLGNLRWFPWWTLHSPSYGSHGLASACNAMNSGLTSCTSVSTSGGSSGGGSYSGGGGGGGGGGGW